MTATEQKELAIPKSRKVGGMILGFDLFVIAFCILAVVNILTGTALIASSIWLALVAFNLRTQAKERGGFRKWLIFHFGDAIGREFVVASAQPGPPQEIRFEYELFGQRFTYRTVVVPTIRRVEWSPGQGTAMAGYDMNDWQVCLWFVHGDPVRAEKERKWHCRPGHDAVCVGPSTKRATTEVFAHQFAGFLREIGVPLIKSELTAYQVQMQQRA